MRNWLPLLTIGLALVTGACSSTEPTAYQSAPADLAEATPPPLPAPTTSEPPPEPVEALPLPTSPPPTSPPTQAAVRPPPGPAFPQFPCQPPNPSDLLTMDRSQILPDGTVPTLGAVERRLQAAVVKAGFRQPRVYQTCGGFVLITSIERARADGRPFAEPGRFVALDASMSAVEEFSLAGVLRALLTVQPGRFRLIAFVVSDNDLTPTSETMSSAAATAFATGGAARLPAALATRPFTPQHVVTALVYEFEKAPGDAGARLAVPPRFSADQHLRLAGIFDALRR
jgi:hypothetical protein